MEKEKVKLQEIAECRVWDKKLPCPDSTEEPAIQGDYSMLNKLIKDMKKMKAALELQGN